MSILYKTVDAAVPSSTSKIWPIIQEFYRQEQSAAWEKIPFVVTNCVYLAEHYARIIQDIEKKSDREIWVFELGSGVCQLAYHLLRRCPHIHYVMVDLRPDFDNFLQAHPQWQQIDSSRFTAVEGGIDELFLSIQNAMTQVDPHVVLITNYVLDSLPTDVWLKDKGAWAPAEMTVSMRSLPTRGKIDFERSQLSFKPSVIGEIAPASYDDVRKSCQQEMTGDYMTIPVKGFDILSKLKELCGDRGTWLIADRPELQSHGQNELCGFVRDHAWSVCVNFKALKLFAERLGCYASLDTQTTDGLIHVMAIDFSNPLPRIDFMLSGYSHIVRVISRSKQIEILEAIALLRYSCFDPWMLDAVNQNILSYINADNPARNAWLACIEEVCAQHYWLPGSKDLLICAELFMHAKDYSRAIEVLSQHSAFYETCSKTHILMGQCDYQQGRHQSARTRWQLAAQRVPDDPLIRQLLSLV